MKTRYLCILLLLFGLARAQYNKPESGDVGVRYGVAFNGSFAQTLALSGMLTNNWELGLGFAVNYSKSNSQSIYATSDYNGNIYIPVNEVTGNLTKSVSASVIPYAVYHFPIKSRIDVYAGANLTIGTGSITIDHKEETTYTGYNFYQYEYTGFKYPYGYQVGGGVLAGCQYFFYKKLAVGVEANLGAASVVQRGTVTLVEQTINSGSNNFNTTNAYSTSYVNMNNHTFSFKSASSAGIYLTFYFARKLKKQGAASDRKDKS